MERTKSFINQNKTAKKGNKNRTRTRFEWEEAVDYLAKYYNLTWSEVTDWNIIKFNHRFAYVNFKLKKDNEVKPKYKSRK